jgi:hypothetical protein
MDWQMFVLVVCRRSINKCLCGSKAVETVQTVQAKEVECFLLEQKHVACSGIGGAVTDVLPRTSLT